METGQRATHNLSLSPAKYLRSVSCHTVDCLLFMSMHSLFKTYDDYGIRHDVCSNGVAGRPPFKIYAMYQGESRLSRTVLPTSYEASIPSAKATDYS